VGVAEIDLHTTFDGERQVLGEGDGAELPPAILNPGGERLPAEEARLSEIVHDLNVRYGLNLGEGDRLQLRAIAHDLVTDPEVQLEASANSFENFSLEFDKRLTKRITQEMRRNEDFSLNLLNNDELRGEVARAMGPDVFLRARVAWQRDCPIGELLKRVEDQYLEYKSTLEWDIREGRQNKLLRTPALKTVAALLNSYHGGTLVLGVADDRSIVGLEGDLHLLHKEDRDDADRFQLHLTGLVRDSMGIAAAAKVMTQVHEVEGHALCRVHVEPSGQPVQATVTEVDGKGQHQNVERFFVRVNGSTWPVTDETERAKYIADRWGIAAVAPRS